MWKSIVYKVQSIDPFFAKLSKDKEIQDKAMRIFYKESRSRKEAFSGMIVVVTVVSLYNSIRWVVYGQDPNES